MNSSITNAPPVVLCFSGNDPTSGAGISADIEAISSQGCIACPIITCLTVQDSTSVVQINPVSADIIRDSATQILNDMPVDAIKIGLLGSTEAIVAVHELIAAHPDIPVVLDPILASGDGTALANAEIVQAMIDLLLPLTRVITPNSLEAKQLSGKDGQQLDQANILMAMGCDHVLITGTHLEEQQVVNRLFHNNRLIEEFSWPRLPQQYHGSGCTLTSALAALMAQGLDPLSAAAEAQNYSWHSLNKGFPLGKGQWHPNRFYWTQDED